MPRSVLLTQHLTPLDNAFCALRSPPIIVGTRTGSSIGPFPRRKGVGHARLHRQWAKAAVKIPMLGQVCVKNSMLAFHLAKLQGGGGGGWLLSRQVSHV